MNIGVRLLRRCIQATAVQHVGGSHIDNGEIGFRIVLKSEKMSRRHRRSQWHENRRNERIPDVAEDEPVGIGIGMEQAEVVASRRRTCRTNAFHLVVQHIRSLRGKEVVIPVLQLAIVVVTLRRRKEERV